MVTNNQPDLVDTAGSFDQADGRPTGEPRRGVWSELAAAVRGEVVTAADPGWDDARRPWDLVDQRPAVVVMPLDAADVRMVVLFARRHGLHVAPQGTGHNAGPLGPLEDTILLSTRRMRGIDIDPARRTARVEAGVLWVEVTQAATPHGLFPLSGSSPNVGVVGYTLGGGLSWLARKHGLAANHVTAIEAVTADGRFRRATPANHPDLFWALRGGGGNFGVVTAVEFILFPYGAVYAGMFVWPYQRHLEVAKAWHAWTESASEDITTSLRVLHFPPGNDILKWPHSGRFDGLKWPHPQPAKSLRSVVAEANRTREIGDEGGAVRDVTQGEPRLGSGHPCLGREVSRASSRGPSGFGVGGATGT
jgi:FAD/FMN-containing dehydrogenase